MQHRTHAFIMFLLGIFLINLHAGCLPAASFAASSAPPAELILTHHTVRVYEHTVVLDYGLRVKGLVALRDQLRDGAQVLVDGRISLLQHNTLRPKSTLISHDFSWTIRHDPLTRDFTLLDHAENMKRSPFLDTLVREAWKITSLTLRPEAPLEKGETYTVAMNLILKYAEVPPWLKKALFFWSWELSPSLSFEETFTYPQVAPATEE